MNLLVHASCVAIADQGVLLMGPSGSGKSDLALRLIDEGAQLVSDDQTLLSVQKGRLVASCPPSLKGLLEVRTFGILQIPCVTDVAIALCIDLVARATVLERMPGPDAVFLLDQHVQRLSLSGFTASASAQIRAALRYTKIE